MSGEDFERELKEAFPDPHPELADAIYRALCNVQWQHETGERYSCSWRYAGGLASRLWKGDDSEDSGDYLMFYLSGGEGEVHPEIAKAMGARGWKYLARPMKEAS